jgi:hypothetical protein
MDTNLQLDEYLAKDFVGDQQLDRLRRNRDMSKVMSRSFVLRRQGPSKRK